MTEVRIPGPVRARFVTRAEFWDDDMACPIPGALYIAEADDGGPGRWYYACPCGCGATGGLRVAEFTKPEGSPSWVWNGSLALPTLHPSVHYVGHWHGWLRNGEWVQA